MTTSATKKGENAIGTDVVTVNHGPNITFRMYLVERPTPGKNLRAVEGAADYSITLPHPIAKVWPIFKNFDSWMNRFGYVWDGLPAANENNFAYLRNNGASNDSLGAGGDRNAYVVRKVIPGQVIYFDSLPYKVPGKDCSFTGHNLMALHEENGQTKISIFMEHTWYSETMTVEELRAEAKELMLDNAPVFWKDYFITDLISLVENGKVVS